MPQSADLGASWADRSEHWLGQHSARPLHRAVRERNKIPLVLCGHGVTLRVDRGTLAIQNGFTHYPQERETFRFFKGDLNLPPRIVMLDGSGSISFDVITWLSEQSVPLVRIDWRGEVASVVGGDAFAIKPERLQWQIETRNDAARRLDFCCDLIVEKLRASLRTMAECLPASTARQVAVARAEGGIARLVRRDVRSVDDVRDIEMRAAAAYFTAWRGVKLDWRSPGKFPIPDDWLAIGSRRSMRTPMASNRHATHPVNAILNYAYTALRSQVQIEAAADGYDARRGIMHFDRDDVQALVSDLMEPRRPVVDGRVLRFIARNKLSAVDFPIREDGVCRLSPQLARRVCEAAAG
jgi:CRISPR-associated endonuclease Cas1